MSAKNGVKVMAQRCIARCESRGVRGKKRDELALEFFVGALSYSDLMDADRERTERLSMAVVVIAARGFSYVQEIAKWGDE